MPAAPQASPSASSQPSPSLLGNLRAELMRHPPFAQMQPAHVDRFIAAAEQVYYAPGETVMTPADGPPTHLTYIRQGYITGRHGDDDKTPGFEHEAGALFPVGAVMGARPVTANYRAHEDAFCLVVPAADVRALAADSAPFADFLAHRALKYLELSRRAVQATFSSQTLSEQSLETPLGQLALKTPLAVPPQTPLAEALTLMHDRRIGSVLVADETGAPLGILTRYDILGRVTLAQVPLSTPIAQVMTTPIRSLSVRDTAQDAALLMSRHGIRHVPVTQDGRLVGLVSERDLFAMQRLSLKHVSTAIRAARDVEAMAAAARDIRHLVSHLLGQGVAARQLTQLISHLNDLLTERLVEMLAKDEGVDMARACWLAFGSEGRSEQTIATDQDNGLVFVSDDPERDRPQWLKFARRVNEALDYCGYPLCKGNVMASNPLCCLTADEWSRRFANWMERGEPEDLLNASIYFDLRPLAGAAALATPLTELVQRTASALPRFIKQLAGNALRNRPPLSWLGGIETREVDGREMVDLKFSGTAIFVDVARLYALAHGVAHTGTRERFETLGPLLRAQPQESQAWIAAFEYLQMLRLQVQMAHGDVAPANPNMVELDALNDIDRRMLKESFRVGRRLQQKMELDYQR
ncbi:MAG: CBS domain-containing protein [Betaproteobacteria bacterium]|nr:CBS domain-containing protein [Betaproteobacteria bacterium]